MIAGVLLVIYGIYTLTQYSFTASNVKDIISRPILYIMVGGVVFLEGVVVQGFKKIYALVLHLAAILPYYLAIQQILSTGSTGETHVQAYISASGLYFAVGVILNILGLVANNLRRVKETVSTSVPKSP
jgi:hypothetical protein